MWKSQDRYYYPHFPDEKAEFPHLCQVFVSQKENFLTL